MSLRAHLFRDVPGRFHAAGLGGKDDLGAERAHRLSALRGQMLRHDQDHAISAHGGSHRQRDAGVAAGRLDQGVAQLDLATLFRLDNHRERRTILDRAGRIVAFELGQQHIGGRSRKALQLDDRGVADGIFDGFVHGGHRNRASRRHFNA